MAPFWKDETGAVTVDFVVLTGAIVGLGVAVTGLVQSGSSDLGNEVSTQLSGATVASLNFPDPNAPQGPTVEASGTYVPMMTNTMGCSGEFYENMPDDVPCSDHIRSTREWFRLSDGSYVWRFEVTHWTGAMCCPGSEQGTWVRWSTELYGDGGNIEPPDWADTI